MGLSDGVVGSKKVGKFLANRPLDSRGTRNDIALSIRLVRFFDNHDNRGIYPTPKRFRKKNMSSNYEMSPPIETTPLQAKRERVFLLLAGIFLGSLTMLNILGISRFIAFLTIDADTGAWRWFENGVVTKDMVFLIAVGVLPYPVTFLCTDLICEFYGRKRANWVVIVGLILNIWVMFILWVGGALGEKPPRDSATDLPQIDIIQLNPDDPVDPFLIISEGNEDEEELSEEAAAEKKQAELNRDYRADVPWDYAFYRIRALAFGAIFASMIAYLVAQFTDVYLFHFWKKLTRGKHLWLRNNGSTMISQLVDTVAVIVITHFLANHLFPIDGMTPNEVWGILFVSFIVPNYLFKLVVALLDTIPFYLMVSFMKRYLEIDTEATKEV